MGRLCYPTQAPAGKLSRQADNLSRCKEGMACVFAVQAHSLGVLRVSRYKVERKQIINQGIQGFLRVLERSRYKLLPFCQWSRSKSKNHDKQLTHIVRVSKSAVSFLSCRICNNSSILFFCF